VLGSELRRCQNCEARHAFLGPFALRLGPSYPVDNHDETNFRIVATAIFVGIAVCLTVAFMILRRFHSLPF
jgi:succinate dehydrogenase/fumarate reductase-like Fe-S protein